MDEIVNLADYLVIVDSGRTVAAGQAKELMDRFDLWSSAWCGPLPDRGHCQRVPLLPPQRVPVLAHMSPNDNRSSK